MKKIIVGVVVLVIIGVGGFFTYKNFRQSAVINNPVEKSGSSVEISNFKFIPSEITVKSGETITIVNKDIVNHTFISDQQGLFDTGPIGQNQTQTIIVPTAPGQYPFHCIPHPFMKGVLIVKE